MPTSAVRVVVSGQVHGVGFRAHAAERARELGLRGYVRNVEDGTVESMVAGPAGAVEAYLAALRSGPPAARVSDLSVEARAPETVTEADFRVR